MSGLKKPWCLVFDLPYPEGKTEELLKYVLGLENMKKTCFVGGGVLGPRNRGFGPPPYQRFFEKTLCGLKKEFVSINFSSPRVSLTLQIALEIEGRSEVRR